MKKLIFCCILALTCASVTFAKGSSAYVAPGGTWIWPLGDDENGKPVGEVVIRPGYVENPVHGNVFANINYYISAEEGMPVYAPVNGTLGNILFNIMLPDGLNAMAMGTTGENIDLSEYLEEMGADKIANMKKTHPIFVPENISKNISIQMNDGSTLYLSGFLDISVERGQKVTRGQQIGTLGYNPTFYTDPSLSISMSGTELGAYLLGEDNSRAFSDMFGESKDISYQPEKVLTNEDLTEAWDIFKIALLEDHPALIDPLIATNVQEKMAEVDIRLNDMETVRVHDFRLLAKEVLATAHCLHSQIGWVDAEYRFSMSPLQLVLHEGQCFVAWDRRGNNEIPTGTEIFAVNGIPIQELAEKAVSSVLIDTINPEVAQRQVEPSFTSFLELYFLNDSYSFTLANNTVVELPILNPEQVVSAPGWVDAVKKSPYEQLDDDTALLRVEKMNRLDDREPWIAFFKEISESDTKNLILDLRGNGGGVKRDTSFLLSYFLDQPFQLDEYEEIKHGGVYNSGQYSDMGHNPNAEYPLMLASFQTPTDGAYRSMNEELFEPVESYGFKGNLYVLVDTLTASAAVSAAAILANNGAVTIGSETRGGYYSTNAHTFITLRLGETNLELYMPLFRVVTTTNESSGNPKNRGLIPQHIVYNNKTLNEKLTNTGSDSQLTYTLELIKSKEQKRVMAIVLIVLAVVLVLGIPVVVRVIKKRRKMVK